MSSRLAQGPYVAARAGVEPTTVRLKVIVSTKAPPRPTIAVYSKSRTAHILSRGWAGPQHAIQLALICMRAGPIL